MPHSRMVAWVMWVVVAFFYAYQYILRVIPNLLMPILQEKFGVDGVLFGQFSGLYYLGYAGLHIPLGYWLDHVGVKKILPFCMVLVAVGLVPLWYAESWAYPMLGRFLIGVGSSAAILGVFKVVRQVFPPEKFSRMLGFAVTIGLFGAIYGGRPIDFLIQHAGWEVVLQGLAVLAILFAAITWWLLPATLSGHVLAKTGLWRDLKTVLSTKPIFLVSILGGLMVGPLEGFADVWGSAFLREVYGFDEATAAALPSSIFLGMCLGASFVADYAARKSAYYPVIMGCALGMGLGFLLLLYGVGDKAFLASLFFVIGVLCCYQIIVIARVGLYVGDNLVGLTTALTNTIVMSFGYFFHTLIGIIKEYSVVWIGAWGGTVTAATTYKVALAIIPIGLFIGFIGMAMVYRQERLQPI